MKTQFLLLLLLLSCPSLWAQYVPMNAPLVKNGVTLRNPWAGGLNLPQFSEVDLNNDGIQDLVVYDREGAVATTYINNGTPGQVDYDYAPEYMKYLPKDAINFMLFRDYNCDGIKDLFGMYYIWAQGAGIAVWKGSYLNDTIRYTLAKPDLKYDVAGQTNPYKIFLYGTDLPAIDDIDGDGDMDVLAFTLDFCFPANVFWYKNMSMENGHGCDSLEFFLESECYGLFQESGDSSIVQFGPTTDSCYNNQWFNQMPIYRPDRFVNIDRDGRHVGANITAVDIDGDGVKELALGSVTFKNANMVGGVLLGDTVLMTNQDHTYPSYNVPIDIFSFVSTYFLDVNNDGKTDMIAAPSELGFGEAVKDSVAWYYQNTMNNSNMVFNFQQKDFLVGDMLDIGEYAFPVLFDFNADGLMDIVLGSNGRPKVDGGYFYGLTLLQNTGTQTNPSFELITNNYGGFSSFNKKRLYPTFGDLDGDGDLDMICGSQTDSLIYIPNIAGAGNTAVWGTPVTRYKGIRVGGSTAPTLVDLDRDGDLDLVIGTYIGSIRYYENTGSPSVANFSSVATSTNLGGFDVQTFYSRNSMPHFFLNSLNKYEMLIGHEYGNIIHLGNIDGNVLGVYDTLSQNFNDFYEGLGTHISTCDLDNDGKIDYLLGTNRGGMMIMMEKDTFTNVPNVELEQKIVKVYPNPTQNELTVSLLMPNQGDVQITIYNALGQVVQQNTRTGSMQQFQLDVSGLNAGLFFLEINNKRYREVVQFVKR